MTTIGTARESLPDRVRRLRLQRQMSRIELAKVAGVSKSHVHQIETGQRRRMRLSTLEGYARALGVPASYIDYGYWDNPTTGERGGMDLMATLRGEIGLEDDQIERVLQLIQRLEAESARPDLTSRIVEHSNTGGGTTETRA